WADEDHQLAVRDVEGHVVDGDEAVAVAFHETIELDARHLRMPIRALPSEVRRSCESRRSSLHGAGREPGDYPALEQQHEHDHGDRYDERRGGDLRGRLLEERLPGEE